jgi:hypothetical protein
MKDCQAPKSHDGVCSFSGVCASAAWLHGIKLGYAHEDHDNRTCKLSANADVVIVCPSRVSNVDVHGGAVPSRNIPGHRRKGPELGRSARMEIPCVPVTTKTELSKSPGLV